MKRSIQILRNQVDRLNEVSRCKYGLEGAYGSWQLQKFINGIDSKDGVVPVLYGFRSKEEMYDILSAILRYIEMEKGNEQLL